MFDIFYNEMVWWLFGTAIIFTFVGRFMSFRGEVEKVVAATIDSLIEDGYIKTKLEGNELTLIKHTDWNQEEE